MPSFSLPDSPPNLKKDLAAHLLWVTSLVTRGSPREKGVAKIYMNSLTQMSDNVSAALNAVADLRNRGPWRDTGFDWILKVVFVTVEHRMSPGLQEAKIELNNILAQNNLTAQEAEKLTRAVGVELAGSGRLGLSKRLKVLVEAVDHYTAWYRTNLIVRLCGDEATARRFRGLPLPLRKEDESLVIDGLSLLRKHYITHFVLIRDHLDSSAGALTTSDKTNFIEACETFHKTFLFVPSHPSWRQTDLKEYLNHSLITFSTAKKPNENDKDYAIRMALLVNHTFRISQRLDEVEKLAEKYISHWLSGLIVDVIKSKTAEALASGSNLCSIGHPSDAHTPDITRRKARIYDTTCGKLRAEWQSHPDREVL